MVSYDDGTNEAKGGAGGGGRIKQAVTRLIGRSVFQVDRTGQDRKKKKKRMAGVDDASVSSPLFEKRFVHGEAQHGEHGGPHAGPQPERGVLQVCLRHVPGENSTG